MLRAAYVLLLTALFSGGPFARAELPPSGLFARTNLVAWCIVPFDTQKRGPEARAAMLDRLGLKRLAYDWRAEHIPTFDAEVAALQQHGIELTAWWFPAALNDEAKAILACLERHRLHPQLWVTMGTEPELDPVRLEEKRTAAVATLSPICAAAAKLGSTVALYNHLGWFGEPTNQVLILERLRAAGHTNVGSVYNFHHAHAHIDDFAQQLQVLKPYLLAINLNGMVWEGDRVGKKIIPLGTGDEELRMLQILNASGWSGPVGIIGHTEEDAEVKLRKELDGLSVLAPSATQAPPPPKVRPTPPAGAQLPAVGPAVIALPEGKVLDARVTGALVDGRPEFRTAPLEVEARVRLGGRENWNILVASEAKSAPTHWELYTFAGTGDLSFYCPALAPDTIRSGVDVCDGQWHTVGAREGEDSVTLFVDGRPVARQVVTRTTRPDGQPARIAVGRLVEGGLGCNGWIASVTLKRDGSPKPESWSLTPWEKLTPGDSAAAKLLVANPGTPAVGGSTTPAAPKRNAGEPLVSGREPGSQGEKDWVDNRWQETDVGPFLASNLRLPDGSMIAKGLSIKLGGGAVAYDTATGAVRAVWTGGFLQFDPGRFGLIGPPRPGGPLLFPAIDSLKSVVTEDPAFRFIGLHNTAGGTVLEYRLGEVRVLELPTLETTPAGPVFVRSLWVEPHATPIELLAAGHLGGTNLATHTTQRETVNDSVAPGPGGTPRLTRTRAEDSRSISSNSLGETVSALAISGQRVRSQSSHIGNEGGFERITLEPSTQPTRFDLRLWRGNSNQFSAFTAYATEVALARNPVELPNLHRPPAPVLTTRGQRGPDTDFLAVDTLTMPYDNPSKALMFASGVDFTPDGAAYVCTIHGDVWKVTGIDDSLRELKWQRFATGLFQPLGLKVRDGQVFVLGRDRITRLHDENGDGEADFYESFYDGIQTSTGGHDYVTCLEKDDAGNFYYVDPQGVHRVAADGRQAKMLATGFRNPNGMGVSPDGRVITVAPQQGTWTPSSQIAEIRPGGYYGFGGPQITASRPLGFDAPLLWIPHGVDNSSGSQVWIPQGRWDALGGQMLHLLWGRCGMMLVLRDTGGREVGSQGAVVPLPAKFLSGPNRASFNPRDGALWSTGWQTSAVKDGALQRVRWTGRPMALPVAWRVRPGGLEFTFSQPLDRATAEDAGSYALKQWNYRYASDYGSKDWSVTDPAKEGRDDLAVTSAKLLDDGRTVFLAVPELKPVMQMELRYNVDGAAGGKPLRGSVWLTVNDLHPERPE